MNKLSGLLKNVTEKSNSTLFRTLMLLLAAGCMIFGCMRGELSVVLGKAVTVCMECIGLG